MATVNQESFRQPPGASRRSRRQARGEIEVVEQALTRGLGESVLIMESLRWLIVASARQRAFVLPVAERERRRLATRRPGILRNPVAEMAGESRRTGALQAETRLRQPALLACFGTQAMSNLNRIIQVYQRAWGALSDSSTRISRRAGTTVPGVSAEHGAVIGHAPVTDEEIYGGNAIHLYDRFFQIGESSRYQLVEHAGRANDLELLRAAVLVHEILHWVVNVGHQRHGDLRNPQNYEFYMPQKYDRRPLSYSELNVLRRP